MAKLSDFLGVLVSSICDARVNSDLQSLRIAEEYKKNDLLKHFSVPRMRIDKVELNIPVAVDSLIEKPQRIYQLIDSSNFSKKAFKIVRELLSVKRISSEVSKKLRTTIAEHINLLEEKIKANQTDNLVEEFSSSISLKTIELAEEIYKKKETSAKLKTLQLKITKGLVSVLKEEFVLKQEIKVLDSLHVIVEADKLRDIKPENVIMIKMIISEQGMEWINMEDKDGKVVNKLMPE